MSASFVRPGQWLRVLAGVTALFAAVIAGSVASASPASAQFDDFVGEFVGQVDADTFIGVVSNGHDVIVYVCDGFSVASWHRGVLDNGAFAFDIGNGDLFDLDFVDQRVRGRRILDPNRFATGEELFQAELATGAAGIFRAEAFQDTDFELTGGWIVLDSGDFRGAVINTEGEIVGSGDLDLETMTAEIGGERVSVERLTPESLDEGVED